MSEKIPNFSNPENTFEREKYEKIVILLRHPSTRLNETMKKGTDDTPWDDLEDKIAIERGAGHDMSKELALHLLQDIPNVAKGKTEQKKYGFFSSPLPRAEALARYVLLHIKSEIKNEDSDIAMPGNEKVEIIDNFREVPMTYTKGELIEMLKKVQMEGKPLMSVMQEWFEKDPEFVASIFEKERQRVVDGLKKMENSPFPINYIFTHRLVTGFALWLIKSNAFDKPIEIKDLPEIMESVRKIPYVSESEIGFKDRNWEILRHGDAKYLKDESLNKGTF